MEAYKAKYLLKEDGKILLEETPFHKGDCVEVTISSIQEDIQQTNRFPLRETPYKFDDPFSPAVFSPAVPLENK